MLPHGKNGEAGWRKTIKKKGRYGWCIIRDILVNHEYLMMMPWRRLFVLAGLTA